MNNILFVKGEGGLGRPIAGKDHYCGLVVYCDTKPSGFAAEDVQQVTSLPDAEAKGITADHTQGAIKVLHYHLEQFFAVYERLGISPQLWVMIADVPATTYDFEELTTLQDAANGELRTAGIYHVEALAEADLNTVQTVVTALEAANKPLSVVFSADITATTDLSTLPDLRALTNPKVMVTIGEDGGSSGSVLAGTIAESVGNVGSVLAWASIKNVSWNLGWVEKFNVVNGGEYDVPAFGNGKLVSANTDKLDGLNTKGYVFLMKHTGLSGTYFNDAHMCVAATSDYAYLENNQTIDKAIRGIRTFLLPDLNRPLQIDPANGHLDPLTVSYFENKASRALQQMVTDGELSGFGVYINPEQDVLSSSTLVIEVKLVINGVARTIKVNIGFTKKV